MIQGPATDGGPASATAALPAPEGYATLVALLFFWTVFWCMAFYFVRWIQPLWMQRLPRSLKAHEDDENWCARNFLGSIHAIAISCICIPNFLSFLGAPDDVKFAASPHLDDCHLDPLQKYAMPWNGSGQWIAFAGLMFTTFLIADIIISYTYGLATLECRRGMDHIVHHAAFIAVGLVVRGNCMMPFNASMLLLMEMSTPFLNYTTMMLNRGRDFSCSTLIAGTIFSILFVVVRIVLNTYGVFFLWFNSDIAIPEWAPEFEFWFVYLAVVCGVIIQYLWLVVVLRKFRDHWAPRSSAHWKASEPMAEEQDDANVEDAVESRPASASTGVQVSEQTREPSRTDKTPACFAGACSIS